MTAENSTIAAQAAPPAALSRRDSGVITILLVAAFVVILNETAMNVALTSIMADLGVVERTAQWLTTAFLLTMAVVIPITGWLLERLPTRTMFGLAMGTFSLGTLACAVAPTFGLLLAGRIIQATGTAVMLPLLMTTVMQLVPASGRGKIMGNISLVISVAPAIGPTMAGLVLSAFSWRFIFVLVLPIAVAMLVIGVRRIVNVGELLNVPLDVISIPLTVVGFGGLVFGLSRVGDGGAAAWEPGVAVAVGLAGVLALVLRQLVLQRSDKAFLDLRTFTYPTFSIAIAMMAIAMMALFGTIIMLPLILQRSLDLDPLTIGLMLFPGGVVMGVLGPVVGRLYDRLGPRALVTPASFVVAGVFLALSTVTVSTPVWAIVGYHMAMSASFAFIFTPLFTVSLGSVAPKLYSHASAIVGTVQQVAGAAGTALFVTVLAVQAAGAEADGIPAGAALLVGSHWAFLGATAIWTVAMVASFFLRKPPEPLHSPGPAH